MERPNKNGSEPMGADGATKRFARPTEQTERQRDMRGARAHGEAIERRRRQGAQEGERRTENDRNGTPEPSEQPKKKKKAGAVLRVLLSVVLIGVMFFSGYQVVKTLLEYQKGVNTYKKAGDEFVVAPRTPRPAAPTPQNVEADVYAPQQTNGAGEPIPFMPTPEPTPTPNPVEVHALAPIGVDFEKLTKQNPDCVGWMYCPDTQINYPVMQGKDNAEYLYHMLDKTYNTSGSLFMDYRNERDLSDLHTIIYGHAMKNLSMFGSLKLYAEQSYFDAHPYLYLLTPDADYRLDVIAGATVPIKGNSYTFFEDDASMKAYLREIVEKSTFRSGIDIEQVDRIITLSTCSRSSYDERVVLICWPRPLVGE